MIWLFFSLVFIFLAVLYIFAPSFRQIINARIEALGYWLIATFHLSTWIVNGARWVWHMLEGLLLGFIWLCVGFILLYVYAYNQNDQQTLLYILIGSTITLYLILTVARWFDGVRQWIMRDEDAGDTVKSFCTLFLWVAIQIAFLSVPNGWYFNHLEVVGFLLLLLLVFTVKQWYYGKPPKHAGWVLSIIFVGALIFSIYENWEIGQFTLPRPIESRIQQKNTESDRESLVREIDAAITLAVFQTLSVGYVKTDSGFVLDSEARFVDGDTVSVDDHKKSPVHYKGEMLYEVVTANDFGDFLGTNVWVPARKLRFISPIIEPQTPQPVYNKVGEISEVGDSWKPDNYLAEYLVEVPARSYVWLQDPQTGAGKIFNNSLSKEKELFRWRPCSERFKVLNLMPKGTRVKIFEEI